VVLVRCVWTLASEPELRWVRVTVGRLRVAESGECDRVGEATVLRPLDCGRSCLGAVFS
jgi:hypothetical protein